MPKLISWQTLVNFSESGRYARKWKKFYIIFCQKHSVLILRQMAIFSREVTVSKFSPPFWKEVFSYREELAPLGGKFFPFRVDPFSEGDWCIGKQKRMSQKSSPLYKMVENLPRVSRALNQTFPGTSRMLMTCYLTITASNCIIKTIPGNGNLGTSLILIPWLGKLTA